MKISQLKNLIKAQESCQEPDIEDYSEIPTIKYEQLDQLRCYIDLAIIFEEEYIQLLNSCKDDFLSNYELVNDFLPKNIKIDKSYVNIGLDLNEFLQNSLILKNTIPTDLVSVDDLNTLFSFVCTNSKEITEKFISLLMFFELADKNNEYYDVSKFKYACGLYEMTLNNA